MSISDDAHRRRGRGGSPEAPASRRDRKLRLVLNNAGPSFSTRVRAYVRDNFSPGEFVTGEDIRLAAQRAGIRPHVYNAWGAVIGGLVKSKKLVYTGHLAAPKDLPSNASETKVYQVRVITADFLR
ncbi:MAG TPA: hypothetical protein VFB50_16955 [Chloroflexota bacterium]|nr:hypothetical protein [Chloroflexota bacterium]